MDRKLVFFDIDGTVWDWQGVIPDSAKRAIKKLKENGHIPVICSGRARGNILREDLFDMGFEGVVAACGEYVEYNGKVICQEFIKTDVLKKVVELSNECKVPIVLEGPEKHWISKYGFEKDDFVTRMYNEMKDRAVTMGGFTDDMKANKFSGDVITGSDYDRFKEELIKHFTFIEHGITPDIDLRPDKDLNVIKAVFECVIPGTSKAKGMKALCEYLGVDMEDTFAFGDSNNDLEMIEAAKVGIAMGNGTKEIKEKADYITDDIWEDGIEKALKHFELI
ncbi:MAG: Cof-type HAD-IIB family hydrolase [Lachnospiraceae bacterium]|nr:Cof-type HAD-IIB family hydrolase [Lachnospiraceae bacterium]